ncbi:MAG: tyrosine--tRNA ligase [Candidatus Omnitrophica bacterium]|nr:tyrosine--tRNA ligase [Candidatus Omnitrophota bacterium]
MPADLKKQSEILREGIVDLINPEELEKSLAASIQEKRPLRIKYGADPSTADLHLGHTVPLRKLKQFQEFGHKIVFIIGDFTARIGDPSGRSETRPMLTPEEVKKNALTYQDQVFKILDRNKTEVRYNSEWLDKMTPADFLHLASQYTVARLLERDDFQKRFKSNHPIALVEFLYPLLQGYDSVIIKSDLELGGTDQRFNLLVGRELQKIWKQKPQMVMTMPLLEGTDGVQKMSKSYNNAIAIGDSPREMFGKIMSLPDSLIARYFQYAGAMTTDESRPMIELAKKNPREAKAKLGEQVVSLYHGQNAAHTAREEFDHIFRDKGLPDEIPTVYLHEAKNDLVSFLHKTGLVPSKSEGRRLIEQGGVKIGPWLGKKDSQSTLKKISDPAHEVDITKPLLVQCGKRKFAKVELNKK